MHCKVDNSYDVEFSNAPIILKNIPIEENTIAYKIFKNYFSSLKISIYKKIFNKLKSKL